jgi:hypothetical protein
MEGRTDASKLSEAARERLRAVQSRVRLAFNFQPLKPLDVVAPHPWIRETYQVDHIFGPELFFGIRLAEAWPEEEILLIKRTEGGTTLQGCWNAHWSTEQAAVVGEAEKPALYDDMYAYVRKVLGTLDEGSYELCAVLWVQGERDGKNERAAAAYGDNLAAFIARLRTDFEHPSLPFLLFEVGGETVVAGMRRVAAEVENVTLLPQSQEEDSPDFYAKIPNGHYNYLGQTKLGLRFAEAYLENYGK